MSMVFASQRADTLPLQADSARTVACLMVGVDGATK